MWARNQNGLLYGVRGRQVRLYGIARPLILWPAERAEGGRDALASRGWESGLTPP